MNIALIGMSGVGKTYWAEQLEKLGYLRLSCDDMIAQRLFKNNQDPTYEELANWMGYPWEESYYPKEQEYKDLENKVTQEVLNKQHSDNTVIDTAGSVIYCQADTLAALKKQCKIIYLKLTNKRKQELINSYIECPRPILWNGSFNLNSKLEHKENIQRCYEILLAKRELQYEDLADISIQPNKIKGNAQGEQLLDLLNNKS